jgi:hypothetical protein
LNELLGATVSASCNAGKRTRTLKTAEAELAGTRGMEKRMPPETKASMRPDRSDATDVAEARRQNRRYRHRANRERKDENALAEAEKTRRDQPAE